MKYYLLVIAFFALIFDELNIFFYLVISSFLHESGHIIACFLCGSRPHIDISVFGIKLKGYPNSILKKMVVIICGPAVNLILIIVSMILLSTEFNLNIYVFMVVNTIILLFNCLPIYFLDGGQIAMLFLQNKYIRAILDIISILIVFIVLISVSNNVIISICLFSLFIMYYFINRKAVL